MTINITAEFENADEMLKRLEALADNKKAVSILSSGTSKAAKFSAEKAKEQAPEVSGDLKRSIKSKKVPLRKLKVSVIYEVIAEEFYSKWVEFGLLTRGISANPFMRRGVDGNKKESFKIFRDVVDRRIKREAKMRK